MKHLSTDAQLEEQLRALDDVSDAYAASKTKQERREEEIITKVRQIFHREMKRRNDVIYTQQQALRALQEANKTQQEHAKQAEATAMAQLQAQQSDITKLTQFATEQNADIAALQQSSLQSEECHDQLEQASGQLERLQAFCDEQQTVTRRLGEGQTDSEGLHGRLEDMQASWDTLMSFLESLPEPTLKALRKHANAADANTNTNANTLLPKAKGQAGGHGRSVSRKGVLVAMTRSRSAPKTQRRESARSKTSTTTEPTTSRDKSRRSRGRPPFRSCLASLPPTFGMKMYQKSQKGSAAVSKSGGGSKGASMKSKVADSATNTAVHVRASRTQQGKSYIVTELHDP
jgi:hypothetical protein